MEKECDCLIGRLSSEDVNKSNIIDELNRARAKFSMLKKYGLCKDKKDLTNKEMADNRRGYLHRFKFCPYCGEKLDWKEILKNIKK